MDRKYIDDHHVVARYLAEQLSAAELAAFETYYLEHPEMLREMEAAARLKAGLAELRDAGELDQLLKGQPRHPYRRYLAAAAVGAVAIGVGFVVLRGPSMQPLLVATSDVLHSWRGAPLPLASTHTVLRTRSITYDAEIELPDSAHTIELRVLPEYEAQPAVYRIVLQAIGDDDSVRPVARIAGLAPAQDGFVPVFINTARISPGRYRLTLSGDAGTTAASEESSFLLRFRASGEAGMHD
jgi:hypothetical protein